MRRWMTSIRANGTNQTDWPTGIYISAGKSASAACLEHRQEIRDQRTPRADCRLPRRDEPCKLETKSRRLSTTEYLLRDHYSLKQARFDATDRSLIKRCNFHESLRTASFRPVILVRVHTPGSRFHGLRSWPKKLLPGESWTREVCPEARCRKLPVSR